MENGKTIVITVKLTVTELAELDRCKTVGGYGSRSSVIRAGLGTVFSKHGILRQTDAQIEGERRKHRPRGRNVLEAAKVIPAGKSKKGDPMKMSASRRRKSSV